MTATDATDGTKTANTSPSITVNGGAFAKLQLLMPGETAAPGTATGKTGTPTRADGRHGVQRDRQRRRRELERGHLDMRHRGVITSSDANAALPSNAALVAGTKTFSVTLKTAGSQTVTATDSTDGAKTANTSPSTTVNAGAFAKLQILVPGRNGGARDGERQDRHADGADRRHGVHRDRQRGGRELERRHRRPTRWRSPRATPTRRCRRTRRSSPARRRFSVTLKTAGSRTVTATDVTDGTKTANTSPAMTVNAGAFAKLQILMPGETAAPGTATRQDRHADRADGRHGVHRDGQRGGRELERRDRRRTRSASRRATPTRRCRQRGARRRHEDLHRHAEDGRQPRP